MSTKIKFWQWPNILAIDASIVALAWLWVFALEQSVELNISAYAVLALSVWLTYTADRLFDAKPREDSQLVSARHQFAKRHGGLLWFAWWGLFVVNLIVAATGLSQAQLNRGFVLLFLCLAYTGLNHLLSKRFFPKELIVALIFTGGTQVFLPEPTGWKCIAAFTLLCLINCLAIGWKETAVDTTLKIRSISSISDPRWFHPLMLATVCFAAISSCPMALLPSIVLLLIIQIRQQHFRTESFRVLCDALLLAGPLAYFFGSGVLVR